MSRLRVLLSVELDDDALAQMKANLVDDGETLYTIELGREVKHWPGEPHEWTSFLDIRDLVDEGIIPRTEVIEVTSAPAAYGVDARSRGRRLLDKLTRRGNR